MLVRYARHLQKKAHVKIDRLGRADWEALNGEV